MAHLPYHQEVSDIITNTNIKHIFIVRDPRDVLISQVKYIAEIDLTHPAHELYATLSDEEKLMVSIQGKKGITTPIDIALAKYSPWISDKNCLVVKFEDLIGSNGGGDDDTQKETVKKIAEYLELSLSGDEIDMIAGHIFSRDTITFRKGTCGDWVNEFKVQHIEAFRGIVSDELLSSFGYEWEF